MTRKRNSARPSRDTKLSRTHAPPDLSPADWQRALRRQFGREQAFAPENKGAEPFFSKFHVSNPQSKTGYRVAIRGVQPGENFCSCPDYATNELGTCKHIEFVLAKLEKKRGAKAAFVRGYRPTYSEIYLRYDGLRTVHFRAGTDCPPAVLKAAALLCDAADSGRLREERFRDDPDCRVFLSTDAGAAGLNLQHASTVVNTDLPWNPAILEQRIARIHRMGQKRPVQVVNFVSKGTIEEGMLSVLAFKRSLSSGILDGGAGEISPGGSRLSRFMKDVENVTGQMGEGETVTPMEEAASVVAAAAEPPAEGMSPDDSLGTIETAPQPADAAVQDLSPDPWAALLQIGTQLVSALTAAGDTLSAPLPWIVRDPATGARSLRVPLPPPETGRRLADALSAMADSLRGKSAGA